MLHALYIVAFSVLAVLAVSNLIRNMMLLGADARRGRNRNDSHRGAASGESNRPTPSHPEMLDEKGRIVDEPLLVMRSISLEDAREQLDALYDGSSGQSDSGKDEE